jgi:hypothetical protein
MKHIMAILVIGAALTGCDPEHRKKCEWYLMPDPARREDPKIDSGMIPVCARNLVVNKEDCRFQANLELAQAAWNKKFRYVDVEVSSPALPRKISKITYCE